MALVLSVHFNRRVSPVYLIDNHRLNPTISFVIGITNDTVVNFASVLMIGCRVAVYIKTGVSPILAVIVVILNTAARFT